MAEITYICKRTAVSTKPVQPGKHHNPSVLDRLMENKHVKIVFYYPSSAEEKEIGGETTRRLRESLAEMLNNYPMVTGRLMKNEEGKWMIKCNDAGVRVVEARAKGRVEEWLKSVDGDGDMELKLVHWEDMFHMPYFWSTFYVQITEFEEGGFAVGLSCYHLLADPICATMFVKSWADTTSAHKIYGPSLFHPQPRPINDALHDWPRNPLIKYYKSFMEKPPQPPSTDNSKFKTIALSFSDHDVWACMTMAQDSSGPNRNSPSPSPFAALAGLFWARISKIRRKGKKGFVKMSICLDKRKTLDHENDTFGNCMIYNAVEAEDQEENPVAVAVSAVTKAAAEMDDKERIMELIEWLQCDGNQSGTLNNGSDLICMSLEGLAAATNPYLAAFGEGVAPVRVSYYVEPVGGGGQVLILPAAGEERRLGRVVMATLLEDEVVKVLEDEVILSLRPTVMIGMGDKKENGNEIKVLACK